MNEVRLIDANALKEEVNKKNVVGRFNILLLIDNAPTVDLKDIYQEGHYDGYLEGYTKAINEERPQGEYEEGTQGHYCSICYEIDYSYYDHNYCPYCGAKMKGGAK